MLKPDQIRVVILGQDPYYAETNLTPQANGIAFDVNPGTKIPPSLRNVRKELKRVYPDAVGDLTRWVEQGVFMLNTFLTVIKDKPGNHRLIWERFTDHIIQIISNFPKVIFVLWGKHAERSFGSKKSTQNRVLITSHPSPLSCTKTDTPFLGSDIFKRINDLLQSPRLLKHLVTLMNNMIKYRSCMRRSNDVRLTGARPQRSMLPH